MDSLPRRDRPPLCGYPAAPACCVAPMPADHIDFLVMQPDCEQQVIRDLLFAVMAFNTHSLSPEAELQVSFPLFDDLKVAGRARPGGATPGPVVGGTGAAPQLAIPCPRH